MPIRRKSLSSFKAYSSEMLESIKQAKTVWPLGQQAFGWFCSERKFLLKHTDDKRFRKTLFRYQRSKNSSETDIVPIAALLLRDCSLKFSTGFLRGNVLEYVASYNFS
jgi:hypothetical protein